MYAVIQTGGKQYRVKVSGVPTDADLERLRRGIFLDGARTRPCRIERISTTGARGEGNCWLDVTLHEGRTRQIRRMFETIGHPVSKLKRVAGAKDFPLIHPLHGGLLDIYDSFLLSSIPLSIALWAMGMAR